MLLSTVLSSNAQCTLSYQMYAGLTESIKCKVICTDSNSSTAFSVGSWDENTSVCNYEFATSKEGRSVFYLLADGSSLHPDTAVVYFYLNKFFLDLSGQWQQEEVLITNALFDLYRFDCKLWSDTTYVVREFNLVIRDNTLLWFREGILMKEFQLSDYPSLRELRAELYAEQREI